MSDPAGASRLRFGEFELDERTFELRRAGQPVALQRQPARVLATLAAQPGELVSRDDLRDCIWGDLHVDAEQGLNNAVHQIRAALGDDSDRPRFVETLPRAGYRFVAEVERVVERAPALPLKGTAGRDQSAESLPRRRRIPALAALAAAATLAALAILAVATGGRTPADDRRTAIAGPHPLRLAVLPFENLGADELAPLRTVLAEELITSLAALDPDRLAVISRGSMRAYESAPPALDRVARDLAADYAVEGSLRREQDRTLVVARLVRVADGTSMWSGRTEIAAGETTTGAGWLALQLRDALARRVTPAELPPPPAEPRPRSAAAWVDYLEGRYRLDRVDAGALEAAREAFARSLALDPRYAPARLGLAESLWRLAGEDAARRDQALTAAGAALALAPDSAAAHLLRAEIAIYHQWDAELAERHYARALELGSGLSEVHSAHGFFLVVRGENAMALAEADRARELDPISAVTRGDVGLIYAAAGRPEVAARECARAFELEPRAGYAAECLVDARLALGDPEGALQAVNAWRSVAGGTPTPKAGGEPAPDGELARFFARRLTLLLQHPDLPAGWVALAAARAGDTERALELLAAARRARSPSFLQAVPSPAFHALRRDPRFADLVAGTPVAALDDLGRATGAS